MGTPLGPPTRVRSRGLGAPPGWPSVPAGAWVAGGWLDAGFPPRPSSPASPRIVAGVMANVAERLVKKGSNFAVSVPTWPFHKRSEEHTSELQSHSDLVCRLLLEKKKRTQTNSTR